MAKQFRLSNYTKILVLLVVFIIFNSWYMLAGHSDNNHGNIDKINIIQTDRNEEVKSLRGVSRETSNVLHAEFNASSITNNIYVPIATLPSTVITTEKDTNLGLGT